MRVAATRRCGDIVEERRRSRRSAAATRHPRKQPGHDTRFLTTIWETSMRKLFLLLLLVLVTPSLFAQDWRDRRGDRSDRYRDNAFELTPFAGYRWGGTLYSNTGL